MVSWAVKPDPADLKTQESIAERKSVIRNDLTHCFKELRDLMGERLMLLESDPVDTTFWHDNVTRLLMEKITLLERIKLGAPDQPPQ